MEEAKKKGEDFNIKVGDLRVNFYGNTAVVTGFETGSAVFANGKKEDRKRKYSSVWVKEKGSWKEVHAHLSLTDE